MDNIKKKILYLQEFWGENTVKYNAWNVRLEPLIFSEHSKECLSKVGLPVTAMHYPLKLLPFTLIHSIEVQNQQYYIFGEMGVRLNGTSFFALTEHHDTVYRIFLGKNIGTKISFFNSNLFSFLFFHIKFNLFDMKYSNKLDIDVNGIKEDYENLFQELNKDDEMAFSPEHKNYWKGELEYIRASFGDYLL